jgi:cell wall-associated NlpC family hydrolase
VRLPAFRSILVALLAGVSTALLVTGGASAEPTLASKEAQAQAVLAQVREIDSQVSKAAEAYNRATIEFDRIREEQRRNAVMLTVARSSLVRAQAQLEERLVAIYTSGDSGTTIDVLLGATSIEDLLNRLETVDRVSSQDAEVLRQVTSFGNQVRQRKARLAKARARQEGIVAERAAQRRTVEAKLRERQALLSTIRDQIREIRARERARQLSLARQARARISGQYLAPDAGIAAEAAAALAGTAPPSRYGGVVGIAMQYLGIPYRWGGSSPSGFDCSGFVMYVYAQMGVSLPHNAAMQYGYGVPVSKADLQPGDLVFFDGLGHNGIYIGAAQFIHSPHTGDVVKISSLDDAWYSARWYGAKRLTG